MLTDHTGLSPFERSLTLFTRVRPGEGRSVLLFFLHGFLLLFSWYVVRVLRDAFISHRLLRPSCARTPLPSSRWC